MWASVAEETKDDIPDGNVTDSSHFSATPSAQEGRKQPAQLTTTPHITQEKNYTRKDISICLQRNGTLPVLTNTHPIYVFYDSRSHPRGVVFPMRCTVNVSTVSGKKIVVDVSIKGDRRNISNVWFTVNDGRLHYSTDLSFRSTGVNITLEFHVRKLPENVNATCVFKFEAVEEKIDIIYLSSFQGLIHCSDPKRTSTEPLWVEVPEAPLNHLTVISVLQFNVRHGNGCHGAKLFKGEGQTRSLLWDGCDLYYSHPHTGVYDTRSLSFTCISGLVHIKLRYSFHQQHRLLRRVTGDLWNCSVPEWPDFERHFRCNLYTDCEAGEDEAQCFYTGYCGVGLLTLGNRCHKIVHANGLEFTWLDANLDCQRRGGYLSALNSPGEWEAATVAMARKTTGSPVFIGLRDTSLLLPVMYKYVSIWADNTAAYVPMFSQFFGRCWYLWPCKENLSVWAVESMCLTDGYMRQFLCEMDLPSGPDSEQNAGNEKSSLSVINPTIHHNQSLEGPPWVTCSGGHITHAFLACDVQSACWSSRYGDDVENEVTGRPSKASCPAPMTSLPVMFACDSMLQRVPYSMVCDSRQQCPDGSDENFCVFPPCSGSTPIRCEASTQCMSLSAVCNSQEDCDYRTDEAFCPFFLGNHHVRPPPAVIHFTPMTVDKDYSTPFRIDPLPQSGQPTTSLTLCPETHFQCPDNGYCLPVFVRCNGINDCPGREDEAGCDGDSVSCPGYYRCRSSSVCLHPSHVCDGVYQCPQNDDEQFCHVVCPAGCTCHGLAFTCQQPFRAEFPSEARYVDASGSGLTLAQLAGIVLLIHLNLSDCGLETFLNMSFPNLRSLDLSRNELSFINTHHLGGMSNLQYLSLSRNPLESVFSPFTKKQTFPVMRTLILSGVNMQTVDNATFSVFPGLQTLNLSHCGVDRVLDAGFREISGLRVLDVTGCPMTQFPRDLFWGLEDLQTLRAENFKLCCSDTLPAGFNLANCRAPVDEVSSCESLLRSDVYRVILTIVSSLALIGNVGSFVFRILKRSESGFSVFVTHLSISDFLMGVYLAIIGVADRLFANSYLWEDVPWRHSTACGVAGFLSLLSSEMSAFVICLVTLDRFLVLRFPFSSLRFQTRSAHATCTVAWVVALTIAAVPVLPNTSHWSFYSHTGICVPLPVTRGNFAGRHYAFGVIIVFNFILFLLIAAGQVAIYVSVQTNSISTTDSTKKSNDLRIARRLITVAVSDFLCWFPIGLLGLLASSGVPISGEVNVFVAILVLPLNSALNPFLYTVNVILERRVRLQDEKIFRQLMVQTSEEKY